MTLAEYIAQQWEILREYGLIKGKHDLHQRKRWSCHLARVEGRT